MLYGYGGFGISMEPAYSAGALAWVLAGGVWAVAQLRGGGEEGEAWHRAGMREAKQNVFADFEAAARHLRSSGRASALGCVGGSNGGLLVGAAITREPALYDAAVCGAPLLDMVRYERFGLGATWNDEYGTAADPVELGWLLGYSPLHAVRRGGGVPAAAARDLRLRHARSTRCTPASSPPPCSGRSTTFRAQGWCCCAAKPTWATAPARSTGRSG